MKQKISEMVVGFAAPFINMGETADERRNRLNSACTAWNCACAPEAKRTELLDRYIVEFKKCNPQADAEECRAMREDMKLLIKEKVKKHSHVVRQIVSCALQVINGQDHITVISARENR